MNDGAFALPPIVDSSKPGSLGSVLPGRLLTENEAAAFLSVSPRTLQGWRVSGFGPLFVKLASKSVRYRQSDLEAWVGSQVHAHTSSYSDIY